MDFLNLWTGFGTGSYGMSKRDVAQNSDVGSDTNYIIV